MRGIQRGVSFPPALGAQGHHVDKPPNPQSGNWSQCLTISYYNDLMLMYLNCRRNEGRERARENGQGRSKTLLQRDCPGPGGMGPLRGKTGVPQNRSRSFQVKRSRIGQFDQGQGKREKGGKEAKAGLGGSSASLLPLPPSPPPSSPASPPRLSRPPLTSTARRLRRCTN